jgi:alkanesulfonate monooxygenase
MSVEFNWFLPTNGDGRHLVNSAVRNVRHGARGSRALDLDYLIGVARSAEYAGFNAVMLPTGSMAGDGWLLAAAVAQQTARLRLLVSFRPGLELPAYVAHKAATLQHLSGNRLLLQPVSGGSSAEQRAYGDFLGHDARYERTAEFLDVMKAVWRGPGFTHEGKYYLVDDGGLKRALDVCPALYFGGASEAAEKVGAEHADVYLLWGETPPMVRERLARTDALAAQRGRHLKYGLRLHVIARETEGEAWAEAERLLREVPQALIDIAQRQLAASESIGQARMRSLHQGQTVDNVRDLEVYPNLWSGVGLVRGGAGTALVGSYAQVVERIEEYVALGISSFVLSGYPNLEEALRIGEEVVPLVGAAPRQAAQQEGADCP